MCACVGVVCVRLAGGGGGGGVSVLGMAGCNSEACSMNSIL